MRGGCGKGCKGYAVIASVLQVSPNCMVTWVCCDDHSSPSAATVMIVTLLLLPAPND